jgi:hypothetical protein
MEARMMAVLMPFLATLWGRVAVGVGLVAALLVVRAVDVAHQQKKGVEKEQSRVEKQGSKIDAKAQNARRAAERKPADSLREYVRD